MSARPLLRCICAATLICAAAAMAQDKPAADKAKPADTSLGAVTIEHKRNPLDQSDKHLHALQKSLPGTRKGSKKNSPGWYAQHSDPNKMSASQKQMTQNMIGKDQPYRPAETELQRP